MSELTYQLINLRRLSTGRRLFAQRSIRDIAKELGRKDIYAVIDAAIEFDTVVFDNELAWRRSKELPESRGSAAKFDADIDRVLGGIHRSLEDTVNIMEGTEAADQARGLLTRLFPSGIMPVIQQTFEDQLINNKAILEGLKADDAVVSNLGLNRYVGLLAKLVPQFENELQLSKKPEVSWDELCALRDMGNVHLRRVVVAILNIGGLNDADEEIRAKLLAPILFQVERASNSRKPKSDSIDIDPDTGDELSDTTPDTE